MGYLLVENERFDHLGVWSKPLPGEGNNRWLKGKNDE